MKIYPEQTEKWLIMNKSTFWELFEGERKTPIYSYSDANGTTNLANEALNEAISELVNGEYKIRAKQSLKAPNNTYCSRELIIGEISNTSPEATKTSSNMSDVLKMQELLFQKREELIHKDYQLKESERRVDALEIRFNKFIIQMNEFEEEFKEAMQLMSNGKSEFSMRDTIKSGVESVVSNSSKKMFDRFGNKLF